MIRATVSCVALGLSVACIADAAPARLAGDPPAVERIERMIERMGGRELWTGARTLYLDYRGFRIQPHAEPLTELAWRDLRRPAERIEYHSATLDLVRAYTPHSGWRQRGDEVVPMPEEEHERSLAFWPTDFYTLLRRFAIADSALRLRWEEPRRVRVFDGDKDIGWWEIDDAGGLVRWGTLDEGEPLEYLYGPMKSYGPLEFPAWGSSLDGSWRFEYAEVRLDQTPIPEELLAVPVTPAKAGAQ